ncbi:MAG: ATP-binding cassette, subfamily bacterial [Gaiellales bacterium]|nr:ATP-binding cassette, subfamily bacterial [Gaiellales bacterium]
MKRSDRNVYRRLLPLLRPYRGRLAVVLAASALGPLLIAGRIWLLKILIDTVLRGHRPGLLPIVAGAFVAIAVVRGIIVSVDTRLSGWVGTHVVQDLRGQLYSALQHRSMRYFHRQRLGDLLTRLSADIASIEDMLVSGLTSVVSYCVTIGLFLTLLLILNPGLVLVAAGILPVLAVATVVESRRGRRAQEEIRRRTSELTSTAEEGLSAIALVKAFARGEHEQRRFGQASRHSAEARLRAVRLRAVFPPLSELVAAIGTAVVVWVGARQVLSGQLSLGSLVVFISLLASLYVPIQGLSRLASAFQRALVGAERVVEILDAPAVENERAGAPALPPITGEVRFQHVTFGYEPDTPVLSGVSFGISPGEVVALIGASGAGKTTAVSLLLSYYDADGGKVTLDGYALHEFDPASSRRQVAAVLQEPMLLNASVRENIRYGRLEATDAEIEEAAVVAQADRFIRDLPEGYDTVVGPRGSRLSGGQRQRLAIARAVVKDAPVLVLDEATSALDPATEARVLEALRARCVDTAVLLIAHRASTIGHADRIVMLQDGHVAGHGTEAALRAGNAAYRELLGENDGGFEKRALPALGSSSSSSAGAVRDAAGR